MKTTKVLAAVAAIAALALPATAAAKTTTLKGTVVAHDTHRGAWVVADAKGNLEVVRTRMKLKLGWKVTVKGTVGASGALVASKISHKGSTHTVRIRGVKLAHSRHSATIASGGAAVTVTTTATAPDGAEVDTVETISGGSLTGKSERTVDASATHAELSGTVTAFVAPDATASPAVAGSVSLTVEDSTTVVTVVVPADSTATFKVGDEVELRVTIAPGATSTDPVTYTLAKARHDGHDRDGGHRDGLHAEGVLTIPAPGSITVTGEHGAITFLATDLQLAGLVATDCVEARGHQDGASIVLDSITRSDECTTEDHEQGDGDQGVEARGALTIGADAALGTITVDGKAFTIGTVTVDPALAGQCVRVHGNPGATPSDPATLVSIRACESGHGGKGK